MINVNDEVNVTTYTNMFDDNFHGKSYLFFVEVIETEDMFEAWIRASELGIASLMFGAPKKQTYTDDVDYDGFVEMVENNFEDYADDYIMTYVWED